LLSNELVGDAYRERLQDDLDRAVICRFLIAYISESGIDSLGHERLARALRDPRSFGTASLSCVCGFEPLLSLQAILREQRLKYFMDPMIPREDEAEIGLFHSKIVFLLLEGQADGVIYIGSHNW